MCISNKQNVNKNKPVWTNFYVIGPPGMKMGPTIEKKVVF